MKVPGVDVILDLVGASHFEKNIQSLTVEGRLLLVGVPSGSKAECDLRQVCSFMFAVMRPPSKAVPLQKNACCETPDVAGMFASQDGCRTSGCLFLLMNLVTATLMG